MGVADTLEDEVPLLKVPMQQTLAHEQETPVAQHPLPAGSWDGSLLQCCGRTCTGQGWVSCAFAYFLPCFAFGHNLKRAFSASLWLHAFAFFVLFYGVHRAFLVAVNFTADSCRVDPPAPLKLQHSRPLVDANAHATWLSGRKLLQVDDAPGNFAQAFADVLPSAEAHAVVHGGSVEDASPSEPQTDEVEQLHNAQSVEGPFEETIAVHEAGHHPHPAPFRPHPAVIPFTSEFGRATPGCQRAYMGLFALFHLTIVALLSGVVYAARQRTLIRKRFLIPGSACGDVCAWLCCTACALCQETRTLRANNIVNGQWGNQLNAGEAVVAGELAATKPPKIVEV